MNTKKESFEFDLNTFFRLERAKRPSTSIAVYAELLAATLLQGSTAINCEVRFLSINLKVATRTVTETLNEFRRMRLVKFVPNKQRGKKRLIELINEER